MRLDPRPTYQPGPEPIPLSRRILGALGLGAAALVAGLGLAALYSLPQLLIWVAEAGGLAGIRWPL